ncbi:helix-turn-helix transcriptional regulator [Paenibacillus sp. EKM202P]|uniref:helix-turn-helix domain-containing protein n=1 Tax=unclassified Paenibacillus TaxID=185978 RepID=UPI0013EBF245|nr:MULTISPECIES: helix-turn-helix transcriptional regulator [unclassified Paenibacillus]KAF6565392.1 helix-turn-helix transcriptional regulator [Paenibacillus sp. EKM202P]KAF6569283.1 helix-turn-helix transcriptional regulator [Paenibacillus sp. EKM207P]
MSRVDINLKAILNKFEISEREISRRTGIRQATINNMCNNDVKQISLKNISLLCDELGIDISELLTLNRK